MFIFDFVAETILDQILDWIYGKIIGFLNDFFVMMNNMGVELFELPWVNAVTTFFSYLGWALFGVGLVVGAFECAIEYQGGRGSIKDTAMNYIKGFMAVSLFTVVPVNLYSLCVSLQGTFGSAITGITNAESIGLTAQQVLMSASFPGIGNPILMTFCVSTRQEEMCSVSSLNGHSLPPVWQICSPLTIPARQIRMAFISAGISLGAMSLWTLTREPMTRQMPIS